MIPDEAEKAKAGKDDKDYKKPSLLYGLPNPTTCENAPVISDKRTAEEKKQAVNQKLFDTRFGKETTAVSKFITFKVVGMSPGDSEVLNPEQKQQREKARTTNDMISGVFLTNRFQKVRVPRTMLL